MNITISLNNLEDAIKQIHQLSDKIKEFPKALAEDSASRVDYPTEVVMAEGETVIVAKGDQIAFEEFGAGYYAVETVLEMDDKKVENYPGVYSEFHARTFQHHMQKDADPTTYRFNQEPKMYMSTEAMRLDGGAEEYAEEYFR